MPLHSALSGPVRKKRLYCTACKKKSVITYLGILKKRDSLGNEYHFRYYKNANRYKLADSKKTVQILLPFYSNLQNHYLFHQCSNVDLQNIPLKLRNKCFSLKGTFIDKESRACAQYLELLKLFSFIPEELTKYSDSFRMTPGHNTRIIQSLIHAVQSAMKNSLILLSSTNDSQFQSVTKLSRAHWILSNC